MLNHIFFFRKMEPKKKGLEPMFQPLKIGVKDGIRTRDFLNHNQAL